MASAENTGAGELRVAEAAQVRPGTMLSVDFGGEPVLLAHVDGEIHAVRDACSHEAARLSEGELDGAAVECPWHFSRFCLRTGEALDLPAVDPVETYAVRVVGGDVLLSRRGG
ncbi:non-heme iron oxygenase ferredoxin subunit [Streptomyces pactum]|uniref:Non-heme iron oxygenase ferredoxin subunit n=1 Tax=Streptomyces pactum TaxID=68249 RepID=A0ABS0NT79_9ACTN|nr:non-heme iron oxygenase ferredoxin subunit [Streptomyces pactum]MBH5338393.1 non-heme iron oxygenase ferredoxin subunit [Streptomyces pactum]